MLDSMHVTKDGKRIPIPSLENEHLLNIVRLRCRQCNAIFVATKQRLSPYQARLYGFDALTESEAADAINRILTGLSPYFMEMVFRMDELHGNPAMEQIRDYMMSFMTRSGRLEIHDVPQLDIGEQEEEDVWPDPHPDEHTLNPQDDLPF